jgi:hypothetical protein
MHIHRAWHVFVLLLFCGTIGFAASGDWQVVVNGLDNPRGLAFGPEGALYVAEAGRGGDAPCAQGPEGLRCYGATGAITRFDPRTGAVERVASGLPSLATQGAFATGPHDVSLQGRGNTFFTIGFGGDPLQAVNSSARRAGILRGRAA